jgi:hypothetical protein
MNILWDCLLILSHSDYGARDLSTDAQWSEDAHFVTKVQLSDEKGEHYRDVTYLGIADG